MVEDNNHQLMSEQCVSSSVEQSSSVSKVSVTSSSVVTSGDSAPVVSCQEEQSVETFSASSASETRDGELVSSQEQAAHSREESVRWVISN